MAQTDCTRTISTLVLLLVATAMLGAGCDEQGAAPPVTLDDYRLQANQRGAYPDVVVAQHNLHRVNDTALPMNQRRLSLAVVAYLKDTVPEAMDSLINMFTDPATSPELRTELVSTLLNSNDPAMTPFIVEALQEPNLPATTSDAMLAWLSRNATGGTLTEIVKLWAAEPPGGPNESHYRKVVEQMQQQPWDQALMEALNARNFRARGSAIELLGHRRRRSELTRGFMALRPQTEAVAAIQTFINGFGYVPTNKAALVQTVVVYKTRQRTMPQVADLARRWARDPQHPYLFNVRDYPLLEGLPQIPDAAGMTRERLLVEMAQRQMQRNHPVYRAGGPAAARTSTRLGVQSDRVTMADLWTLWLLDTMLSRPRIQQAMGKLAALDRRDTRAAMGGLIVLEEGQAETKLYNADRQLGTDLHYVPEKSLAGASRKAMCRFVTHFERASNGDRVGPTLQELAEARRDNMSGLVVTTLSERSFCAHYYTPGGVVVSIGEFSFVP